MNIFLKQDLNESNASGQWDELAIALDSTEFTLDSIAYSRIRECFGHEVVLLAE